VTTRIDLPDGQSAVLREPSELTNRHRKQLRRAAMPAYKIREKFVAADQPDDTPTDTAGIFDRADASDFDLVSDMQAAYIVTYLQEWTLDRPLPTADTVDDLPGPIFDILAKATTQLGIGSVKIDVDDAVNPESPTEPSPV
jgi:hypothetical protein